MPKLGDSGKPIKPTACIACGGSGTSSTGKECVPCGGTGRKAEKGRTIFVFGSNRQGRHGGGAAREAREKWGAVYGQAEGLQGSSYAVVTKELRPDHPPVTVREIGDGVSRFISFARSHPTWRFQVVRIGCMIAGFTDTQIAPLFAGAPENCELPEGWRKLPKGWRSK